MNANELADWILDEVRHADEAEEIATMLRQQQAEIEALKKLVHQRFDDGKRLGILETEDRLRKAQEQ